MYKRQVYTDESTASLTWTVEVPAAGAYHIEVAYRTEPGTAVSPQREILINGKQTYTCLLYTSHCCWRPR